MNKRTNLSTLLMLVLFGISSAALITGLIFTQLITASLINEIEYNIYSRLTEVSKRGAAMVTAEILESYQTPDDMFNADYQLLRHNLADFAEDADILYIYYLRPAGTDKFQYIIGNDFTVKTRINLNTPLMDVADAPGLAAVLRGSVGVISFGAYIPEWEHVFSMGAPIFDEEGHVVAVCRVDAGGDIFFAARHQANMLGIISITATAVVLVSVTLSLYGYRRESKTAQALRDAAEKERNIYFEESTVDDLTQLKNRRAFDQRLFRCQQTHRPVDKWLCLAILDIDYFKNYNDYYGHPKGDECLRKIGKMLNELRDSLNVYVSRVGGEEFAVLWFEEKDEKDIREVISRIQKGTRDLAIPHEKSTVSLIVTFSIGAHMASCDDPKELNTIYEQADMYLYQAKNSGRNRAVVCGELIL